MPILKYFCSGHRCNIFVFQGFRSIRSSRWSLGGRFVSLPHVGAPLLPLASFLLEGQACHELLLALHYRASGRSSTFVARGLQLPDEGRSHAPRFLLGGHRRASLLPASLTRRNILRHKTCHTLRTSCSASALKGVVTGNAKIAPALSAAFTN